MKLTILAAVASLVAAANADTLTYTGITVTGAIDGNDLSGQTATVSISFADGLVASGGIYSLGELTAASYEFSGAGFFTVDAPQDNLEFGTVAGFELSFFDEGFDPLGMLSGTTAGDIGLDPLDGETLADMFARLGDGTSIAFTQSTNFQMLNAVIGTLNGGTSNITTNLVGQGGSSVTLTLSGTGCPADIDGDGDADADDFFAYLDAFAAGNLDICDIDGDGDCDADDFFGYLDLFAQGC